MVLTFSIHIALINQQVWPQETGDHDCLVHSARAKQQVACGLDYQPSSTEWNDKRHDNHGEASGED